MNTKRKLLFSFVGLILSIAIFSTVVFAWFAISNATGEFVVETGNLETDTKLYHAKYIPATTGTDPVAAHYEYTLVDEATDANNLFENMIPGQILTFQLEITNSSTSTIKADYEVVLGKLFYGESDGKNNVYTGISFSEVTSTTVLINTSDSDESNDQHLFYAINLTVEKVATGKAYVNGADIIDVSTIQGVKIAEESGDNKYKPISDPADKVETLVEKLSDKKLADGGDLAPGTTDIYIIKFYFDPTYGTPNSNQFRSKAFKIENITVNYTQKQQITE